MTEGLSPVYLDGLPISLMGDEARPPVSRIVRAGGKRPDRVDVQWLTSNSDRNGQTLGREEIVDRTLEPVKPIFLRSIARPAPHKVRPVDAIGPLPAAPTKKPRRAVSKQAKRNLDEQQAAEAEAEQRQEDQREFEDVAQDEQEEMDAAESDEMES